MWQSEDNYCEWLSPFPEVSGAQTHFTGLVWQPPLSAEPFGNPPLFVFIWHLLRTNHVTYTNPSTLKQPSGCILLAFPL